MIKRFCLAALAPLLLVTAVSASETDVSLDRNGTLKGTLFAAAHGPAALIVAGSGPTDRDGNSALGVHADTYKLLAAALAAQGITTLRFDKRGVGASGSALTGGEASLRIQTYSDDANAWAENLRATTHASCVWLIGHSEGALLAEMVAHDNPHICGVVLISGAGRKAGDVLREQLGNLPDELKKGAYDAIAKLEHGQTVTDAPPQLASLFRASVQPYMISWLALDPPALLAKLKQPVLILQGDHDIQVSVDDARDLAAARSDAKLVILPGVNHILKIAPLDRAANIATYTDPSLPLAPGIADAIAGFMKEHK